MPTDRIRILIADDHAVFRDGLRALLASLSDIEVVGEAANGEEVINQALATPLDVILMDLKMPGVGGIEATQRILEAKPQVGIIILTMFEDDDSIFAAIRAGARGYILKGARQNEVLHAIRSVNNGQAVFGAGIAERMLNYFAALRSEETSPAFPELTDREREILDLMAQDYSNTAIAEQLALSLKTVQNYVSNIVNKLQVANRTQAIIRARASGL